MEKQAKLFEDSMGNKSEMRVMCMFSMVTAIVLAIIMVFCVATSPGLFTTNVMTFFIFLDGLFIVGAFAPKAIQKVFEIGLEKYLKKV